MKKLQKQRLINSIAKKIYWLPIIMMISIASCKKEEEPTSPADDTEKTDEVYASRNSIPHVTVHPGSSIQAAVNAANAGTIIFIEPGIYKEAVVVNKPRIQLVGTKGSCKDIIIENPGDEENGITVSDEGDGFFLKNVTVRNFEENGVLLTRVDNFVLDHVASVNNSEYGLFPVLCNHGVIKFCSATGSSDTGIYVGQSENIIIQFNVAFANVSGFEIENCTNVNASWNEAYDNTAGLSVFLLPGLTVKTSSNILVAHNKIHDNNLANFAPPGGGLEVNIPQGAGILLVGADNTTIEHNLISRNNFVGVATVSTLVLGALAGIPPEAFADIEPNPDGAMITHNILKNNGTAAPPGLPLPAAELLWDGSGSNNCWSNNIYSFSFPASLPVCN